MDRLVPISENSRMKTRVCLRLNSVFSMASKRQCFASGIFLSITALTPLGVMARSHCTGPGQGTGQGTMDFYIMLCTVHITQGQGQGPGMGTNGLHTHSSPGPVLSNRFCCTLSHSQSRSPCCNVNRTPRSLSRSHAV